MSSQIMDANTSGDNPDTMEELRRLQEQLEQKEAKIKELKVEIESIKQCFNGEKISETVGKKMENLKMLSQKYDRLRAEYNAVLAEKKREKE